MRLCKKFGVNVCYCKKRPMQLMHYGAETSKTVFRASVHSQSKNHLLQQCVWPQTHCCCHVSDLTTSAVLFQIQMGVVDRVETETERKKKTDEDARLSRLQCLLFKNCCALETSFTLILSKILSWSWRKLSGEVKGQESDFHTH